MGARCLIDTNILIEFQMRVLPATAHKFVNLVIDDEFNISIVNKIEILGSKYVTDVVVAFVSLANIFDLHVRIVDETIELRRKYRIKLPDAIIAATALVENLTLVTRNTKDFNMIEGLKIVNPYHL